MKNILRPISILLVVLCLCTVFSGCKDDEATSQPNISSAVDSLDTVSDNYESSVESTASRVTGGAKPKLQTVFYEYENGSPKITWSDIEGRNGWSARVIIKDSSGKTVEDTSGITKNSYTVKASLTKGATYNITVYYITSAGRVDYMHGVSEEGIYVTYNENNTAQGAYYFDGSISLDVLNNYLDRALTHMMFGEGRIASEKPRSYQSGMRVIESMDVKYVQRAIASWTPARSDYNYYENIKESIAKIHLTDPDVIFEACIFECINYSVDTILISEDTFKAFGLKAENRNFSYDLMVFEDGYGENRWGNGSIPDITRLETQMFFYQRACEYINIGFEALHLGQASLIGKNDTKNANWTKVIHLIRDYAKKNARRHYVIINAHYPTQNFVGSDGIMLVDFNAFPLRIDYAKDETDHAVSEDNPQRCDIYPGTGDSVYNNGIRGVSPSGWYTDEYPYLVEFDNWGGDLNDSQPNISKENRFGYDEIAWYAAQPTWYRQQFYRDLYNRIADYDENGHVSAPGCRCTPGVGKYNYYYIDEVKYADFGYGDEEAIRAVWDDAAKAN